MKSGVTAEWVCQRLDSVYGALSWRSHGEPLDTLIQTILSQHTSDTNSERAFDQLRRRFPGGWEEVRQAEAVQIADAIRCGGLADSKAPRIRSVLQAIHERCGETDLSFLKAMSDSDARAYLQSLPGVGPKTAACVLMFALGRPVLPVDTHVFRVSHRLGLVAEQVGESRAHDLLQAQVAPERVYPFHVHLIRHGRRVCRARLPLCEACPLAERCVHRRPSSGRSPLVHPAPSRRNSVHGLS